MSRTLSYDASSSGPGGADAAAPAVVNTDGDPGTTIYVGVTDPLDMVPPAELVIGDVWIQRIPA